MNLVAIAPEFSLIKKIAKKKKKEKKRILKSEDKTLSKRLWLLLSLSQGLTEFSGPHNSL